MSFFDRAAAWLGLGKAAMPASARGRVVRDLSLWEQAPRIGGGLTPRQVSNIIREADGGYLRMFMELANECRQKDAHLHAVLSVNEESLSGLPWQITVPDGASKKDKEAAKWIDDVLRASNQVPTLIAYLAGADYYGFDVNEIVWRKDGRDLIPDSFVHLDHRRFGFRQSDGRLVLRDQGMPNEGIDFREEWRNKFIVAQPRVNGDLPHREGLARLLVWATLFRTWTVADWLKTAEMAWKPWRIGTYKKTATHNEDREDLEIVLDQLATNGWAALPDSAKIDVSWPGGSVSTKATHAELVNVLAQEMSKAALGQTETVQASASSGYGQAKVHDNVRKDLREGRARRIGGDMTRGVVVPMLSLNYGTVPRGIGFEIITEDAIDLDKFGSAIGKLTKAGMKIPAKWARDRAGVPEPKDGEELLEPPKPTAPPNDETEGEDPEESDDEIPVTVEEPEDDDEPAPKE